MPFDPTYEVHKSLEGAQFRHLERDLGHRSALRGYEPTDGIMARMLGAFKRLPLALPHRSATSQEGLVLTDGVCELVDGSTGRIAVRESRGELVEVCVPT